MKVLETINNQGLLSGVATLGIAVSGGSDSMALLHYIKNNVDVDVKVINVEHGIRGQSSERDSLFVRAYCKENGIECICKIFDCAKKSRDDKENLELTARKIRYNFFYELINNKIVDKVATAHNMNDNAESVILHLLRGSGLGGARGMQYQTDEGIIRPLLDTDKQAIISYVEKHSIKYVHDESNDDIKYSRNLLRNKVFPYMLEINEKAIQNIVGFSRLAKQDDDMLDEIAKEYVSCDSVSIQVLSKPSIAVRAFKQALQNIGVRGDVFKTHLDSIMSLKENGKYVCLKDNLRCALEYDKIRFFFFETSKDNRQKFIIGENFFDGHKITVEKASVMKGGGLFIHNDDILLNAKIRYRQDGDFFKSCNGFNKSLNKYFTDKKIPKSARDTIPLLCVENEVLVIFGYEISDRIKVKNTDILRIRSTK